VKFTKLMLTACLSLSMASSFASCYENYQERRAQADEIIKNSNYKQTLVEAGAMSVSTNIVAYVAILATSVGGGPLPSTAGGLGMISGAMIADKYIDLRIDDEAKDAFQKKALLDASINLLKEARIGQGPHLVQALTAINQNVSTSISMKNLADTIVGQDNARVYCMDDRIMSPSGIITLATQELKEQL